MAEFIAYMILGVIGYLVGGWVGVTWYETWNPTCWYGLAIVWGIPFCGCTVGVLDYD
jgi:uncharacterized membrane protein YeaQ/YmgE (transglycosylase-associated protein family)